MHPLTFHIVGESYVDLFCFLQGPSLPELGGDSKLTEPVQIFAGGSTINTATHLRMLSNPNTIWEEEKGSDGADEGIEDSSTSVLVVVAQTIFNPMDEYGQILLQHAAKHNFVLHNCCANDSRLSATREVGTTPHCVVIVSDTDRSFMTHRGCAEKFTASDLDLDTLVNTDGPVHLHVAGFFCTPGFGNESLMKTIISLRAARERQWPNHPTVVSVVTQFDVTQTWDGGLETIVPLLSCLIMNELEATKIVERATRGQPNEGKADPTREWISFFSLLNPEAIFVVTKGADGAIAFRNDKVIGSVGPAVAVQVVDPTGAGDAFAAGFLHGLWRVGREENGNWSDVTVNRALSWGCAVGTAAVTVRGASIPSTPNHIIDLHQKQNA